MKENLKLLKHEKKDYFTVFTQPVFVNLILITFYLSSSFFLGVAAFFANFLRRFCFDFARRIARRDVIHGQSERALLCNY